MVADHRQRRGDVFPHIGRSDAVYNTAEAELDGQHKLIFQIEKFISRFIIILSKLIGSSADSNIIFQLRLSCVLP